MVKTEDVPGAGQAVHLVDEDDAGLVLPRHLEQVLHQLLRLPQPLGHQVRAGHGEESGVVGLCGHGLGQIRFSSSLKKIINNENGFVYRVPNERYLIETDQIIFSEDTL